MAVNGELSERGSLQTVRVSFRNFYWKERGESRVTSAYVVESTVKTMRDPVRAAMAGIGRVGGVPLYVRGIKLQLAVNPVEVAAERPQRTVDDPHELAQVARRPHSGCTVVRPMQQQQQQQQQEEQQQQHQAQPQQQQYTGQVAAGRAQGGRPLPDTEWGGSRELTPAARRSEPQGIRGARQQQHQQEQRQQQQEQQKQQSQQQEQQQQQQQNKNNFGPEGRGQGVGTPPATGEGKSAGGGTSSGVRGAERLVKAQLAVRQQQWQEVRQRQPLRQQAGGRLSQRPGHQEQTQQQQQQPRKQSSEPRGRGDQPHRRMWEGVAAVVREGPSGPGRDSWRSGSSSGRR